MGGHRAIIENFTSTILDGASLIYPTDKGLNSLELTNALLYSSLKEAPVELPLDSASYTKLLNQLIQSSDFKKEVIQRHTVDMRKSFS